MTTTKKELLVLAKDLEIKGRHEMTRDELAAAIAEARNEKTFEGNFIPTPPWKGRRYSVVEVNEEIYKNLPPQAKKIFDYMRDEKVVARGDAIVQGAVAAGYLKTNQDPAVLFAFYARRLEAAGIRLAD